MLSIRCTRLPPILAFAVWHRVIQTRGNDSKAWDKVLFEEDGKNPDNQLPNHVNMLNTTRQNPQLEMVSTECFVWALSQLKTNGLFWGVLVLGFFYVCLSVWFIGFSRQNFSV